MISALMAVAGQTARLSLRGGGALIGVVFFLAVVIVVPFGVGPDLKLLARIGPAMLWIGALLATLLNLDRLFRDDGDAPCRHSGADAHRRDRGRARGGTR